MGYFETLQPHSFFNVQGEIEDEGFMMVRIKCPYLLEILKPPGIVIIEAPNQVQLFLNGRKRKI